MSGTCLAGGVLRARVVRWIAALAVASCGACQLPALELSAPGPLPSIVGVTSRGRAMQVGHPVLEGDSILTGEVWPDERLGWRIGDLVRIPRSSITRIVSLEQVGVTPPPGETVVWAVLSTDHEEHPVRWDGVYVFPLDEPVPPSCERIALVERPPGLIGAKYHWTIEQLRSTAGAVGGNALYLSRWTDAATGETVRSALFGPDWDYEVVLVLWCPGLPEAPSSLDRADIP